jgi:hypothetical protein
MKMNKHSVIVIVASILIFGTIGVSIWNIYAVQQLQLHGNEGIFRFYEFITNEDKLLICNQLPFFTSFNQFNIILLFEDAPKGTFHISGMTIPPSDSIISEGKFTSETYSEAQYLAMHFDTMFQGDAPIRIDPRKFAIDTEFQIMILGVIPYTVVQHHSGIGFYNMLNEDNFDC